MSDKYDVVRLAKEISSEEEPFSVYQAIGVMLCILKSEHMTDRGKVKSCLAFLETFLDER